MRAVIVRRISDNESLLNWLQWLQPNQIGWSHCAETRNMQQNVRQPCSNKQSWFIIKRLGICPA